MDKPGFTSIAAEPLTMANKYKPDIVRICPNNAELLRITPEGEVIAPSLETASEAGRVFVESIRQHIAAIAVPALDRPTAFNLAKRIVESDPVIGVYASCEWDCLNEDGQNWIAEIVRQAVLKGPSLLASGVEGEDK